MLSAGRLARRPLGYLRSLSTRAAVSEYTDESQYPEIQDLSFEARRFRKKEIIAKKVQALPTVEEKVMALNMKKYFGYKCIILDDQKVPYNSLPFVQYCTRTKLNESAEDLPEFYGKFDSEASKLLPELKKQIEEAVFFQLECYQQDYDLKSSDLSKKEKLDILGSSVASQVHRVIMQSLAPKFGHLNEVDTDLEPIHKAFWFVGGIEPLTMVQKLREGVEWQKKHKMDPVDRPFQYIGELV